MNHKVTYTMNLSNAVDLAKHLSCVDTSFQKTLSSRVEIPLYSKKLHERAVRFEAWLCEELIGFVACYLDSSFRRNAFVTNVSVLPKYQRLGIAERLMGACIQNARDLKLLQINLEVDQHCLPAISLYQKLGFTSQATFGSTQTMSMTLGKGSI